jgi:small multidrug resistance pump
MPFSAIFSGFFSPWKCLGGDEISDSLGLKRRNVNEIDAFCRRRAPAGRVVFVWSSGQEEGIRGGVPAGIAFVWDVFVRRRPGYLHVNRMSYLYLAIAIVSEVVATSTLKASQGFTRLVPSLVVVAGYATAFYFLSLTLRTVPTGVAYAIWSGVGVALVTAIAWFVDGQRLDPPAIVGLSLIVAGVLVLNLCSKSAVH